MPPNCPFNINFVQNNKILLPLKFLFKYDEFEDLESMTLKYYNKKECEWSPFEWSMKPKSSDFLSFSGFFGSLKCFKVLMLSGFVINELFSMMHQDIVFIIFF